MRVFSEQGLFEMIFNMHKRAVRDFCRADGYDFYTAVRYFADIERLEEMCRKHQVDYARCRAVLGTRQSGKRRVGGAR